MYNGFILSIAFLLLLFFLGLILSFLTSALLIPIFFTPKRVLTQILDSMDPEDREVVLDLGSGDGRVLFAARARAKIKGVGYEVSPIMVLIANIIKRLRFGFDNSIRFEVASLFDSKISNVDKIYCHLSDRAMEILKGTFERELEKGVTVYSYEYPIPGKRANKKVELKNGATLHVYKY